MPTAMAGEGLFVSFPVSPNKELNQYIKSIPDHIGSPVDGSELEIIAMYPEELAVCGLGRHERRELFALTRPILRKLGGLELAGSEVQTCYDNIVDRRKMASIEIDPSDSMLEARGVIVEEISKRISVHLPRSNPNGWHLGVAARSRRGKLPFHRKPIPETVTLSGVVVKTDVAHGLLDSQSRRYSNKPRRLRGK